MSSIGLSTYAFFWQLSDRVSAPLSVHQAIERTAALGIDLFQICDFAPLETMTDAELTAIATTARDAGVRLEIGTKGIGTAHLRRFLHIAELLNASLLRTMLNSRAVNSAAPIGTAPSKTALSNTASSGAEYRPDRDEARQLLQTVLPEFERAGVRIALETYEQVPTAELVAVVESIDSPSLGICSDPANTVAALENPREVVEAIAPYVINMHVKDFRFAREDGWVGFTLSGAPLGDGLLDYDHMAATLRPHERNIHQIIEHWLPWQGETASTIRLETEWTARSIEFLRRKQK